MHPDSRSPAYRPARNHHVTSTFIETGAGILAVALSVNACGSEEAVKIPAPAFDQPATAGKLQTAIVAGGCFWGVQGVYQHLKGVKNVLSGYAGGDGSRADYESVSAGDSGHAEAVQIVYDPAQVTYGQILQVFFSVAHDPTQLNRQGPDRGTQYRSAIFYTATRRRRSRRATSRNSTRQACIGSKIVTRVDPLKQFHEAESYHQDYLLNHPIESIHRRSTIFRRCAISRACCRRCMSPNQ